jgi:hypothetical protein
VASGCCTCGSHGSYARRVDGLGGDGGASHTAPPARAGVGLGSLREGCVTLLHWQVTWHRACAHTAYCHACWAARGPVELKKGVDEGEQRGAGAIGPSSGASSDAIEHGQTHLGCRVKLHGTWRATRRVVRGSPRAYCAVRVVVLLDVRRVVHLLTPATRIRWGAWEGSRWSAAEPPAVQGRACRGDAAQVSGRVRYRCTMHTPIRSW